MKKILSVIIILASFSSVWAQQYHKPVRPTKNVILMIPDGTSIGVVSAARWYQIYNKLGGDNLALDPYMCGTVKTYCSDAPIGDSAPTTSCYMTGMPQQSGNVATYPESNPGHDLVEVDPKKAYQPLSTILEASKYQLNKATGLVFTVEFPHATPADCSSHSFKRNDYPIIASQMAYNNLDVVFGGGNSLITDDIKQHFKNTETTLLQDDLKAFRQFDGNEKIWALFEEKNFPYDIDRDTTQIPSLAEMTEKAIERLSKDDRGFFLMVEGSLVDWAAHGNDPVACITEFLAFDRAVEKAIEFAKKDGNTTVIVVPDHGNSGFTIGRRDLKKYTRTSIHTLFGSVSKMKMTSLGLEAIIAKTKSDEEIKEAFNKYMEIELNDEELDLINQSKGVVEKDYMKVSTNMNLVSTIAKIMTDHTYFGFTSGGHTGEEVFLATYHPQGDVPMGVNSNVDLNKYLFDVSGLTTPLDQMTEDIFAKHQDVFKGLTYTIEHSGKFPTLIVNKGNNKLKIPAHKSVIYLNDEPITLSSVIVYMEKNDTFYIPRSLVDKL